MAPCILLAVVSYYRPQLTSQCCCTCWQ